MKKKGDKDKDAKKTNFEELIQKNLSEPRLTLDYTGFQFTVLNLNGKGLELLSPLFKQYRFLEFIDLSNNAVPDLTLLAPLPNLITLLADHNNIKDLKFLNAEEGWKNLRVLNIGFNKVADLIPIAAPTLSSLNLTQNKIEKIETFTGHPKLKKLDLTRNKIVGLQGLSNMPELRELCLAENKVKSLAGLDGVPNLTVLDLHKNNIVAFDEAFPMFENLHTLNLRQNLIDKVEQLFKLKDLPKLSELLFQQNPLINKNQSTYFFDVINSNLKLKSINQQAISKGVKLRAFKHAEDKWKAAELKKQAEEEQRRKLEAAEKPPEEN